MITSVVSAQSVRGTTDCVYVVVRTAVLSSELFLIHLQSVMKNALLYSNSSVKFAYSIEYQ